MITAISAMQTQHHGAMVAMPQRINQGASEEASESPAARMAEARRGSQTATSLRTPGGSVGRRLDVRV
ncbi:hypothetical protein CEB3_c38010 [Peptococcaceae bacterium CEB3]|nr:hypothetical protein CEB3_c38010 [Peptococcaceae bacterium CEB3]